MFYDQLALGVIRKVVVLEKSTVVEINQTLDVDLMCLKARQSA
jgi:hypothetical protein